MGEMLISAVGFLWYGIIIWAVIHTITHWDEVEKQRKETVKQNRKTELEYREYCQKYRGD